MFLCSIVQIGTKAIAVFKSGVNQEQLVQDLNVEEEDNKIKEPKLII